MKKQNNDNSEANELRQKAEAELKVRKPTKTVLEHDNLKLIHELQVHQIELEMQNNELVLAKEQAESAMNNFKDLYDFAPSGYLSLSKEGNIVKLNFAAAQILGKERILLKNTRFGVYIHPNSLAHYNQSIEDAFRIKSKKTCELFLLSNSETPICVHIDAIVSENSNECLLTMIDINGLKQLEVELKNSLHHYKTLNGFFVDREIRMVALKKEINELLIKAGSEKRY
jgi:PAS domain-containing protein